MRKHIATAAVITLTFGSVAAHAQTWRPVEQSCDRYLESHLHPGAVADPGWHWLVACTVANLFPRTQDTQRRLEMCVRQVEDRRVATRLCQTCGPDPIGETISCMGVLGG